VLNLIEEMSRRGYEGDHLVNRVLQALPRHSNPVWPTGFVHTHDFAPIWDRRGRRVNLRPMMVRTLVAERDRCAPSWWYSYFEAS
jgi:hypothetical protein